MGFTGTGSFTYDNKIGALEYAAQEILKTEDTKVLSAASDIKGVIKDVKDVISDWKGSAIRFYDKQNQSQSKMMSDLSTLTGTVTGLPAVISGETNKVLAPVNRIEKQLVSISTTVSNMYTSMEGARTSISGLSDIARDIYNKLDNMSNNGANNSPQAVPPIKDLTPDYSDVLNNISDIIGSIRDNISGFDGNMDASSFYPGLHSDLDQIKDVISELVKSYSSSEGFDTDGFTNAVQDFVGDFANSLVDGLVKELIPGLANNYTEFVDNFVTEFRSEFKTQSEALIQELVTRGKVDVNNPIEFNGAIVAVSGFDDYVKDMSDIISQFHADTVERLDNIDKDFTRGVAQLNTSVKRFGKSDAKDLSDAIDSFDDTDVGSSISTGTNLLSSIWGLFKEYAPEVTGLLSWAHIKEHMDQLHADSTMIIREIGVTRSQSLAMRDAVNTNLFSTYGMATLSKDEREQALSDAIRSGAVSQRHLEQATEVAIAYNKLLGTTLDFSQGWAKTLMVTKTNADDYLENVALSIDTFSNNFFVSAEKLQEAAGRYAASATIFTSDFKGFSKAINKAIAAQAAQEASNIQSMNPEEFLDRIAWSDLGSLTESDFTRLAMQFGISGSELYAARADLRDPTTANARKAEMMRYSQQAMQSDLNNIMARNSRSEMSISKLSTAYGYAPEQIKDLMAEIKNGQHDMYADIIEQGDDFTVPDSEAATRVDVASKVQQAANLTELDYIRNMASAFEDQGVVGKIYNTLVGMGLSGGLVGTVGGFVSGILLKSLLKGKGFGGVTEAINGFGTKGLDLFKGGFPEFLSKTKDFFSNAGGVGSALGKVFGVLGAVKTGWDVGSGVQNSEKWMNRKDDSAAFASGFSGGLAGTDKKGISGALANGAKWAALGTLIAPGIGTAIGGALGAVFGAVGGERLSKAITGAFDAKDKLDVMLEDKFGILGRVAGAYTNIPFEFIKNIPGGLFKGLGDLVGGIKSGFEKFKSGDILGGLGDMGMGFVNAIIDVVMGPINFLKSIWEDFTMSAKDRVKKRKGEIKETEDEAKKLEKDQDAADKKLNGIKHSDVRRTGKSVFTATKGRKGSVDASGLNRFSFADYGARKILDRNEPIEHIPGKATTASELGLEETKFISDLPNEYTVVKGSGYGKESYDAVDVITGESDVTSGGIKYGSKEYEEITNKPKTREVTGETDVTTEASTEVSELAANTSAIQLLTEAIQQAYGVVSETGTKRSSAMFNLDDFARSSALGIATGAMKSGLFGIPGIAAGTAIDVARNFIGVNPVNPQETATLTGPIISTNNSGSENIAGPIVDSINTNMASVVSLLNQLVKSVGTQKVDSRDRNALATRHNSNNKDDTNRTDVLNYQLG